MIPQHITCGRISTEAVLALTSETLPLWVTHPFTHENDSRKVMKKQTWSHTLDTEVWLHPPPPFPSNTTLTESSTVHVRPIKLSPSIFLHFSPFCAAHWLNVKDFVRGSCGWRRYVAKRDKVQVSLLGFTLSPTHTFSSKPSLSYALCFTPRLLI